MEILENKIKIEFHIEYIHSLSKKVTLHNNKNN